MRLSTVIIIVPPGLYAFSNVIGNVPITNRFRVQSLPAVVSNDALRTLSCVVPKLCSWAHNISACISLTERQISSNEPPRRSIEMFPLTSIAYNSVMFDSLGPNLSSHGKCVRVLAVLSIVRHDTSGEADSVYDR